MRIIIFILLILYSLSYAAKEPTVGAIRWDAWSGGNITKEVERTLSPKKYHYRLPWFTKVISNNKVRINGGLENIMNKEIKFAAEAGLDYWAFLLYPKSSSMSIALNQYLQSNNRKKINFCIILSNTLNGTDKEWNIEKNRALRLLQEKGYHTVLNKRPLVYIFKKDFLKKRFFEFRKLAHSVGLNPYFVYMGWNSASDFKELSNMNFDAFSSYAKGGKYLKYRQLVAHVEMDWKNAKKAKIPFIPLVTTGWDKRPRQDSPVSWEKKKAYLHQKIFPSTATPREISLHLQRAVSFVKLHPQICPANTIIIYAWNEYDEGGWISPTWQKNGKPNTNRIDAIKKILDLR